MSARNSQNSSIVAIWNLTACDAAPVDQAISIRLQFSEDDESDVNENNDYVWDSVDFKLVDPRDYAPGGKYRSIVKLFVHYEFQEPGKWAMGTGWLISPDLVVTAGHLAYNWTGHLGRAIKVQAYIGYRGKQSIGDPDVQFRQGKKIVAPDGWVTQKGVEQANLGIIQVDKPFKQVQPFRFKNTPATGDDRLGVVGYPTVVADEKTRESGAVMHDMWLPTHFDLTKSRDGMLQHLLDDCGALYGSPILRASDMSAIATHVYGGPPGSACCFGEHGVDLEGCIKAMGVVVPDDRMQMHSCSH